MPEFEYTSDPAPLCDWPWNKKPPKQDGYFFYTGCWPNSHRRTVCIVQVVTNAITGIRLVFALHILPEKGPELFCSEVANWNGQWAGPEYGLCTVTNQ